MGQKSRWPSLGWEAAVFWTAGFVSSCCWPTTGLGLLVATRAFVGTNPADEPITSGLLVILPKRMTEKRHSHSWGEPPMLLLCGGVFERKQTAITTGCMPR
jgi:hypothetical protein